MEGAAPRALRFDDGPPSHRGGYGFWTFPAIFALRPLRPSHLQTGADRHVTPEDLERERKASAERRRKQFESLRREKPVTDPTETRSLTRAQRAKLRDDDFVAPKD